MTPRQLISLSQTQRQFESGESKPAGPQRGTAADLFLLAATPYKG